MQQTFNNPDVLSIGWYALISSKRLKKGKNLAFKLLDRDIVLFRGENGKVCALDSRCPHLGADLSRGCVVGNQLQCEFHHWRFGFDGQCQNIPYSQQIPEFAKTFSYPIEERYGYIWLFNGNKDSFPIPYFDSEADDSSVVFELPTTTFNCHTHIINCNALDIEHMRTLHNMNFVESPQLEMVDDVKIKARFKISLNEQDFLSKFIRNIWGEIIELNFTTWGANSSLGEVPHKIFPIRVIFNHIPLPDGKDQCRTFFLLPKKQKILGIIRMPYFEIPFVLLALRHFLIADVKMLNSIRFWPHLTREDTGLKMFIDLVNKLGAFHPKLN